MIVTADNIKDAEIEIKHLLKHNYVTIYSGWCKEFPRYLDIMNKIEIAELYTSKYPQNVVYLKILKVGLSKNQQYLRFESIIDVNNRKMPFNYLIHIGDDLDIDTPGLTVIEYGNPIIDKLKKNDVPFTIIKRSVIF